MTTLPQERRLTTRVLTIWKKIAGKGFPKRSQVDPRDFGSDWANCVMIDIDKIPGNSRFSHVGNGLRDATWPTFDRQCVSECLEGSLLELVTRHIGRVAEKKKPVSFGGSASHEEGDILYRTILLPLSEAGNKIDGILAAVAYREVSIADEIPLADNLPHAHEHVPAE